MPAVRKASYLGTRKKSLAPLMCKYILSLLESTGPEAEEGPIAGLSHQEDQRELGLRLGELVERLVGEAITVPRTTDTKPYIAACVYVAARADVSRVPADALRRLRVLADRLSAKSGSDRALQKDAAALAQRLAAADRSSGSAQPLSQEASRSSCPCSCRYPGPCPYP